MCITGLSERGGNIDLGVEKGVDSSSGVLGVMKRGVSGVDTIGDPKSLACEEVTLPVSVSSSLTIY